MIDLNEWQGYYRESKDFLKGRLSRPSIVPWHLLGSASRISFPVYISNSDFVGGGVVFFNDVNVSVELSNGDHINNVSVNATKSDISLGNMEDIKDRILKAIEELLGAKYPFCYEFIDFSGSVEFSIGVKGIGNYDLKTDGSSFNTAFATYLLLSRIKDLLRRDISLTGKLEGKGGKWSIEPVSHIKEKFFAVMCYPIEVFFLPEGNRNDIKSIIDDFQTKHIRELTHKKGVTGYRIDVPRRTSRDGKTIPLEIVFVNNIDEVFRFLFDEPWETHEYFRQVYDLGYQYKQHVLRSDMVKIRNVVVDESQHGEMNDFYVRLQAVEKKQVEERAAVESGGVEQKYRELEEKKKQPPVLPEEILKRFKRDASNIVVVFAEAGSGKSTMLRNLLWQTCNEDIEEVKDLLPVYIPLGSVRQVTGGDFGEKLIDNLEWAGMVNDDRELRAYLKRLHTKGKGVIFLLDAYDEMSADAGSIHNNIRNLGKVIVTSRYLMTAPSGDQQYEVMPLEREDVERFAKNHLKDAGKFDQFSGFVEKEWSSGIRYLLENPLMLSLIVLIIKKGSQSGLNFENLTRTRLIDDALKTLVNTKLTAEDKRVLKTNTGYYEPDERLRLVNNVYGKIASDCFHQKEIDNNIIEETLDDDNIVPGHRKMSAKEVEKTLKALTAGTGLLEEYREVEELGEKVKQYRFLHRVFYEYFVAHYVVDVISRDKGNFANWINEHKFDLRYENVFRFIAGLLDIECAKQKS